MPSKKPSKENKKPGAPRRKRSPDGPAQSARSAATDALLSVPGAVATGSTPPGTQITDPPPTGGGTDSAPTTNSKAETGTPPGTEASTAQILCHISDKVQPYEVDDIRKSVCRDLETTRHADGRYYCLLHLPTKEKDVEGFEKIRKSRFDEVEAIVVQLDELHNRREAKLSGISYDFRYVWFPVGLSLGRHKFVAKANFVSAMFSGRASFTSAAFSGDADFSKAAFSGDAYFIRATFWRGASFNSAAFLAVSDFTSAVFFSVSFINAIFAEDANFHAANFTEADFGHSNFLETSKASFNPTRFQRKANFAHANIAGYLSFTAGRADFFNIDYRATRRNLEKDYTCIFEGEANFSNALIDNPEKVSFHTVRLRPSWFVNTDPREMVFTDCRWENIDRKFRNANIKAELNALKERKIPNEKRLLEIACRQLAVNAEENNRYEDASKFRYMAMETKRLEYLWQGRFWTLSWWYRFSSGYGESWGRAALVLIGIILFFGLMYESPWATFENPNRKEKPKKEYINEHIVEAPDEIEERIFEIADFANKYKQMNLGEGYVHSLYVAALQRPDPKPAGIFTQLLVIFETIFAPLQAALLALAIRRKFMR